MKKLHTLDLYLALDILAVIIYTIVALKLFVETGGMEPSALTYSVFGFCGGEAGICGWIKSSKVRQSGMVLDGASIGTTEPLQYTEEDLKGGGV